MRSKSSLRAGISSEWWWNTDADLKFTYMSDRFTEVFGIQADAVLGKRRTDLNRTDCDNPAWRRHLDDLAQRRAFREFETSFVDAAGISRPVSISGCPAFSDTGEFQGYVGVGRDLTALRKREADFAAHTMDLEAIVENIDQGVALLDGEHRIRAHNRRLAKWLGVDPETGARGRSYEEIVRGLAERGEYFPEDKEKAIALRLEIIRSGKPFHAERKRADGQTVAVSYTPLATGGGVMTYTDVTEARRRELELSESDALFRSLFMESPLPKWVYDVETLKFLEVNNAAISNYGYSRDEFLAMTLADIRPAEELPRLFEGLRSFGTGKFETNGWRHRHKSGRLMEVDLFLCDIKFKGSAARLAVVIDVTARNEVGRENERIFETSQDVILVTDSKGTLVRVSPSGVRTIGYSLDEMIGRSGEEFIFAEDLDATRTEIRATRRGNSTRNFRSRYVHKDGRVVSLFWTSTWSPEDRHFFYIGRDMTEYEQTEAVLRQAQKMEAVGQLTGGVAHDFNNILMVILANIESLEEDEALGPEAVARVKTIETATGRAADLTRQLLAFSRKQTLRPQRTNVNDLVTSTGKLLRRTLGEQIEIDAILADDLWDAEIDRAQLDSALVNLCINARDAMPAGGRLLIETANRTLDEDYVSHHPGVAAGDYVLVGVSDTGSGIPPELLDKVFDPFFTTKEVGKGSGLGLSMVYGFIRQSSGHIRIYSEIGRGTSIKLYLPRSLADTHDAGMQPQQTVQRGSERVLVVEDDAMVRASVMQQLRSLGYAVAEAPEGAAGLAAFEAAPAPFDLLLTDIVMPGPLNGRMLADEVGKRWPATRVVFMSGYTENAIVHHGRLDPGVHLLSKPFRKADLAQMIRLALDSGKSR